MRESGNVPRPDQEAIGLRFLLRVAVSAAAVWIAVWIVPGLELEFDWGSLLLIGLIMGLVNAVIRPIVKLLSLPLLAITLGLFTLVINWALFALVVWLAGPEQLDLGLTSDGAGSTFLGSLVVSIASWGLSLLIAD